MKANKLKEYWIDKTKHFKLLKLSDKILFLSIAVILIVSIPFLIIGYKNKNTDNSDYFKCPESYNTQEEKDNDLDYYIIKEKENNPEITLKELLSKRYDLLVENKCAETLKNIKDTDTYSASTLKDDYVNSILRNINNISEISREELCKKIGFTKMLEQEIGFQKKIADVDFVKYFRETIDNFLAKDNISNEDDSYINFLLSKEDTNLLKGKFIILQASAAQFGGEEIYLMFKEKPNTVFYVWIYSLNNGEYDLRGFSEYGLDEDDPSIEEIQETFINQICNDDFGI
jgi:hypothetical protein